MSKSSVLLSSIAALLISACAASVHFTPAADARAPKSPDSKIQVFGKDDSVKVRHTVLGLISIDDTGFTTDCAYDVVLAKAVQEARTVGADAIKIVQHERPDLWSSCHRIKALAIAFD